MRYIQKYMKITVDKEGRGIINQLLDGMLKAYGISFMKDAEFINSIIEDIPEVVEEIKEEE